MLHEPLPPPLGEELEIMMLISHWPPSLRTALCYVLSKGIRLTFSHRTGSLCPQQLYQIRSFHLLSHLIPSRPTCANITSRHVSCLLELPDPVEERLLELESTIREAKTLDHLPSTVKNICEKVLAHRLSSPHALPTQLRSFLSWNLNSLRRDSDTRVKKKPSYFSCSA